jgi:hypothetical protein
MSRANASIIKGQTRSTLLAAYTFAQKYGIKFRVASINAQVPYSHTDPFNKKYMQTVFQLGYSNMLANTIWQSKPEFPASVSQPAQLPLSNLH